jgi:hypothetical protein
MYGGEISNTGHAKLDPALLAHRRERVFLVLAGIFICAMTMLNRLRFCVPTSSASSTEKLAPTLWSRWGWV